MKLRQNTPKEVGSLRISVIGRRQLAGTMRVDFDSMGLFLGTTKRSIAGRASVPASRVCWCVRSARGYARPPLRDPKIPPP